MAVGSFSRIIGETLQLVLQLRFRSMRPNETCGKEPKEHKQKERANSKRLKSSKRIRAALSRARVLVICQSIVVGYLYA